MKSDDIALIQRTLAGDELAFASLVSKYEKQIHAYVMREIKDYHIAEDITQETFLEVFQKLDTLKEPKKFSSWLYTIVKNLCITWHRRNRFQPESLEDIHISKIETDAYSQYMASEHAKTTTFEHRELVEKLLTKLNEHDRKIITLHYFDEMTYAEIGTYLGISENTIKSRLYRARQRLKKYEFMIQEELDDVTEVEVPSQHIKGEIKMADEVTNQTDVDRKLSDMQIQINNLQDKLKVDLSRWSSYFGEMDSTLEGLTRLPDADDTIRWGCGGAYRTATGHSASRGSIWTEDGIDDFLSKAPDAEIVNLAQFFTNPIVVAVLKQLVEGSKSVADLANGCGITENKMEETVEMLIDAALAKRTEDDLIAPKSGAVFYLLNFVGMVIVYLRPEEHYSQN